MKTQKKISTGTPTSNKRNSIISHLKGNHVITKYFPLKPQDTSSTNKPPVEVEVIQRSGDYRVVGNVIILSESDDEDSRDDHEVNKNDAEMLLQDTKPSQEVDMDHDHISPQLNGFSAHKEPESKKTVKSVTSRTEPRNVFAALNSIMSSNDCESNMNNNFPLHGRPAFLTPLKSSMRKNMKSFSSEKGTKRKQPTIEQCITPKKFKHSRNGLLNSNQVMPLKDVSQFTQHSSIGSKQPNSVSKNHKIEDKIFIDLTDESPGMNMNLTDVSQRGFSQSHVSKGLSPVQINIKKTAEMPQNKQEMTSDADIRGDILDIYNVSSTNNSLSDSVSENVYFISDDDDGDLPAFTRDNSVINSPNLNAGASEMSDQKASHLDKKSPTSNHSDNAPSCHKRLQLEVEALSSIHAEEIKQDSSELADLPSSPVMEYNNNTIYESPNCSQDSDYNSSHVLEKLNRIEHKSLPLTPRHSKIIKMEHEELYFDDVHDEERLNRPPHKITFTLNRILKDKKKNEELKLMEERLLADLKKGGFAHSLDESSDEESCANLEDESHRKLEKIISSNEDCLGLEDSHEPVKLLSRRRLYCCYCPHKMAADKSFLPEYISSQDLLFQLHFIKNNIEIIGAWLSWYELNTIRDRLDAAMQKTNKLFEWLLMVISSNFDNDVLCASEDAITAVMNNCPFQILQIDIFQKAIHNLGIKPEYYNQFPASKTFVCKKCKSNKPHLSSALNSVVHVLRVFTMAVKKFPQSFTYVHVSCHVTLMCLLLSRTEQSHNIHRIIVHSILDLVDSSRRWQDMRLEVTKTLLRTVGDLHTLQNITSLLPTNSERTLTLRRSIAQSALHKCLDRLQQDEIAPNLLDGYNIEPVKALASKLTIGNIRSFLDKNEKEVTNRMVFNTLWCCVLFLQICLGNERLDKRHKDDLESITESLRSLNFRIRDNGCLYCSEAKHYVRIATARFEFQLQEMPKSHLYQQGIFKYLREPRVAEEIVEIDDVLRDADDGVTTLEDSGHATGDHVTSHRKADPEIKSTGGVVGVPLIDESPGEFAIANDVPQREDQERDVEIAQSVETMETESDPPDKLTGLTIDEEEINVEDDSSTWDLCVPAMVTTIDAAVGGISKIKKNICRLESPDPQICPKIQPTILTSQHETWTDKAISDESCFSSSHYLSGIKLDCGETLV